jgi:hypothetical protein
MKHFAILAALISTVAYAGEGWQNRPTACTNVALIRLEKCQAWINSVMQPDNPTQSCCREADTYISDDFEVVDGQFFAIITADYPDMVVADEEGNTHAVQAPIHRGSRILIPPEKVLRDQPGNISGHGIVFARMDAYLYCYNPPPLT